MENATPRRGALPYVVIALVAAIAAAGVTALIINIFQRKQEARNPFLKVVEVTEDDVDPAKWGANWPREYDGYLRTSEPTRTKYGGGLAGPEGTLPPEKAQRDPWLTRVFAGYLFAVDYRDRRGHAFMLQDQEITKRNVPSEAKQSGNCLHCHGSIMPLYRKLGREASPQASEPEQVQKGLQLVSDMNYWDAHKLLEQTTGRAHPVSCVDCHNPKTMELRVTRPAFITGIQKLAASSAAVPHLPSIERWRRGDRSKPFDPNVDGTRQEMRSFVCGQCHVEYYCGKGMTLFFPWSEGLKVEEIEHQYDNLQVKGHRFKDWVHAETGFEVLKAQHPEFEMWSQGIHAKSGVACADCHMPYKREGAAKVSDHWVRSPLLNVNRACQTCHRFPEAELLARVDAIQQRNYDLLQRGGQVLVGLLDAVGAAKARGATPDQLAAALQLQRRAQWRLDFIAAENSMGFHAPQEAARVLGEAIDYARQGQIAALTATEPAGAPGVTSPAAPGAAPSAKPAVPAAPAGIPAATPPSAH